MLKYFFLAICSFLLMEGPALAQSKKEKKSAGRRGSSACQHPRRIQKNVY